MKDPAYLQRLRQHAEQALSELRPQSDASHGLSSDDAAHLLHELNVYRTELELQNQELVTSQNRAVLASERFQTLYENLPIAALVVNRRGQVHNDNAQARALLGVTPFGQVSDYRLNQALSRSDRMRVLEMLMRTRGSERTVCRDLSAKVADGSNRLLMLTCVALPEDQYMEPLFLVLLLDQTAEHERREIQDLTEAVFQNATEAIIVTDADTRIRHVNLAFERMSGRKLDDVRHLKASVLKSGRHTPRFYEELWRSVNEDERWQGEFTNRHSNGSYYTVWATITTLKDGSGQVTGYMSVQTDVTQLQHAQASVHHLTSYDALTGLPNRMLFRDRLQQLLMQSQRSGAGFSLFFIDLDHFKEVNDTQGHHIGDLLLQEVATRLQSSVRAQDTVGRIGGDEFVVLLPETPKNHALTLGAQVLQKLALPMDLPGLPGYNVQASMGVASWPLDGGEPDVLLRNADTAMYAAKTSGRNRVAAYDLRMSEEATRDFSLQQALSSAVQRGELRAFFQPIFHTDGQRVCGAEALVRWAHPAQGLLTPGSFLGVASKSGLLRLIDQWMLATVLTQLGAWQAQGLWPAGWKLSLNQMAQDISREDWLEVLDRHLPEGARTSPCLEIELGEGTWMQPTPDILERLNQMQQMGVRLAIDDFGTGYSSLAYLKHLPVSTLKIDQSFIRDMLGDSNDRAVVEAVIALGQKLGLSLVAEGVETGDQCQMLAELGCALGQGFLVSEALSADEFAARYLSPRP